MSKQKTLYVYKDTNKQRTCIVSEAYSGENLVRAHGEILTRESTGWRWWTRHHSCHLYKTAYGAAMAAKSWRQHSQDSYHWMLIARKGWSPLITKEELLKLKGKFTWDFWQSFFIETRRGNFVWSAPGYDGDGTLRRTHKQRNEYLSFRGRDKGRDILANFCGRDFTLATKDGKPASEI